MLYGNNDRFYSRHSPITLAFQRAYPTVWEFIKRRKSQDYRVLAREMQRRESDFMLGTVCGRIGMEHPDVPVLTIHDCILAAPEHIGLVESILNEEFAKLGVQPVLDVEEIV